jgi:hypothetical protein
VLDQRYNALVREPLNEIVDLLAPSSQPVDDLGTPADAAGGRTGGLPWTRP